MTTHQPESSRLTTLWRQLASLHGNPNWNGDEVNALLHRMASTTAESPGEELAQAIGEIASFIRAAPLQEAGIAALCAGTITEHGGPPNELYAVLTSRLPEVLACAARLAAAVAADFPETPDEEQEPDPNAFRVGSTPVPHDWVRAFAARDVQAVGAYNTLRKWCLPVISIACRHRPRLADLVSRGPLLSAVAPLAEVHVTAKFLLTLMLLPLNEPLLFVHVPSQRAFALTMDCVPINFALHTLLSATLADALGHRPPPAEVVHCVSGQGPGSCRQHSEGTWNLYTWRAAVQPLDRLDRAPLEDWVWNEGRPADIPRFEGTRLLLATEEKIERTWNTQRTFTALVSSVQLDRELGSQETQDLLRRIQSAVHGTAH